MINPVITLFKKELRQNAFIYLFPIFMITAAFAFQRVLSQLLSETWTKNLAIAIPVSLAFSYALQAFDLEENSQTRDFLLTKPLAGSQIILSKFFSGLIALLPLTILWQLALIPGLVQWPDAVNISGFSFLAYLIMIILVYSLSFTVSAWVKGPKKLLVAIFISALGTTWFFYGWLQFLTLLYLSLVADGLLFVLAIPTFTLALLVLLIKGLLVITHANLLNHSFKQLIYQIKIYLLLLLIPLMINIVNHFNYPEIRPFKSFLDCLNGSEEPFFAVDICKQPQGDLYALTDIRGRLGIARRGEIPAVIYQGEKSEGNLLSKLLWSPNGEKILFNENGNIKVLSLSQQEPFTLAKGDLAFWSADSEVILVAATATPAPTTDNSALLNHFRLSYLSVATKESYELQGNLTYPGSSMFWHPSMNTIIAVTDLWRIAFMNLNNGKVEMINLPPPSTPGPIFLTKIAPSGADSYRIAVFTDLKINRSQGKSFRYNFLLYDFSVVTKKATLKANLTDLQFQDILINAGADQVWGSNSFGAYRRIKIPLR
jgi:ABC-type transport system involved in multi-copper enzyme maturation permease subunit